MTEDEVINSDVSVTYIEQMFNFNVRKKAWGYYTDKQVVILVGLFICVQIKFEEIIKIEKCKQFFLPLGIKVTVLDKKTGKESIIKYFT